MALSFLKKREPETMESSGRGSLPIDRINELSGKGFPEHEMIDILRKEGYAADEIDKAMTQVLKLGVTGSPQPSMSGPSELPSLEQMQPMQQQMPQIPEASLPQEYYQPQQGASEEYIEYMIKERVGVVDQKINDFTIKHDELEKRLADVSSQLNNILQARTSEEQLILTKVDSIKDGLDDLVIRNESLEKAFKDTLPALIESVRSLSDLVQRLKREE